MQSLFTQCWENAMAAAPKGPYRVPMASKAQAPTFRASANRYRRKIAVSIYGEDKADEHPYYELEVIIEFRDQFYVTFQRRPYVYLPPVEGTGLWCLFEAEGELVIEQHQIPVTKPGFIEGFSTKAEAETALVRAQRPKSQLFPAEVIKETTD